MEQESAPLRTAMPLLDNSITVGSRLRRLDYTGIAIAGAGRGKENASNAYDLNDSYHLIYRPNASRVTGPSQPQRGLLGYVSTRLFAFRSQFILCRVHVHEKYIWHDKWQRRQNQQGCKSKARATPRENNSEQSLKGCIKGKELACSCNAKTEDCCHTPSQHGSA